MAFSLFGKKPTVPAATVKTPAKPAGRADEPAPAPDDELISLDFTHPGEMPSSKQEKIQVQEVQQVPPAIEQAAMLYAAEQPEPACATLEAAIRSDDLGRYVARAWGMLFDLYQQLNRQQAFEALALEYAAKFETSPPAWTSAGTAQGPRAAAATSRTGVALAGVLDLKAQEQFKQLLRFAEKNPSVRLDLTKLTDADDQGCALLNSALRQLKKLHKDCVLTGSDKLAAILAKKVVPGKREHEPAWLLLLEIYQRTFAQEAFEDTAVNYAVTFEVSPPSWELPKNAPAKAAVEVADEPVDDGALEGDIVGPDEAPFAFIRVQAETGDDVVVDASRLRRMDFIAAANLMNIVSGIVARKKGVRFVKASHLITALWEVLGLDRVARIETRKT